MILSCLLTTIIDFVDNLGRMLVSFFFPPRCLGCGKISDLICSSCRTQLDYVDSQVCVVCGQPAIGGFTHPRCETRYTPERTIAVFKFNSFLAKGLHTIKYRDQFVYLKPLSVLAVNWLDRQDITFSRDLLVVPVPLHWLKLWERGYNQAELLAEQFSELLRLPLCSEVLKRVHYTKSQTQLSFSERKKNVRGAFDATSNVQGKDILLIDDVITSGATTLSAVRALKKAHVGQVWVLALSKAA
ncbi:MAG: ComF family protein [Patescibacteria group bacterium]